MSGLIAFAQALAAPSTSAHEWPMAARDYASTRYSPLSQITSALVDNDVHTWQHASFLVSALFFWWTVFRDGASKPGCGTAIIYLFTTMMHTGALGALLAFSGTPWYSGYLKTTIALGWDPLVDQQLGGLIMWIPGGVVYIAAAMVLGARWLQPGQDIQRIPAGPGR